MRQFGYGLLTAVMVLFSLPANAALPSDTLLTQQGPAPSLSSEINQDIPLSQLVSPSMMWSHLEMDRLKSEGLNAGLPYAYSAEAAVKSDIIRSFGVAQVEKPASQSFAHLKPLTFLMMLAAGFVMWLGLAMSRKY